MSDLTKPSPADLAAAFLARATAEQAHLNEIAGLADKADVLADLMTELRDDCRDLAGSLRAKAVEA